ncbi:ABC transporter ATP-binding protein [Thermus sp.]|uniref:ABC transporter ATP-binding protein n=1 Tax=Thermus sp. TaxID=275 RepID=UPI00262574EA|nr:ABC transporter ATP-binding protein [Thermus sp.]MCX7850243.1 ABC transporter ATP-binding protein [Thermus sp.]
MVPMDLAVKTEDLTRVFRLRKREGGREVLALDRVNLEVRRGELFGLLGPNGAGKTTLIKILATLLAPTSGRAFVAGVDVVENPAEVRRHINMVCGGETSGYGLLTVEENLWMFAQFYGIPSREARRRIGELLSLVGMADRAKTKVYHLSSGMRQKMNVVRGFLTDPEILFLDEPTLGLDVQTARTIRGFIRQWLKEHPDRTILLTTHYMHEADELCDRVAIIDRGRILACAAPAALKKTLQREAVFRLYLEGLADAKAALDGMPGVRALAQQEEDGRLRVDLILSEEEVLVSVLSRLQAKGAKLAELRKEEPTLEDVFLALVGRRLSEEAP